MDPFAGIRAGSIQEFFIVPRHGAAYGLPERGTAWTITLRGREPGRYDEHRATRDAAADFDAAQEFDLTVQVQHVERDFGPGGTAYVEGYAKVPALVSVTVFVRVATLGMSGGLMNLLMQNEVKSEQVRQLAEADGAPVGRVKLVPAHPTGE